jgi:hypothetical protein
MSDDSRARLSKSAKGSTIFEWSLLLGQFPSRKETPPSLSFPKKVSRQKPGNEKLGVKAQRVLSNGQ